MSRSESGGLFDVKAAAEARDEALERVEAGTPVRWRDDARAAIVWCALKLGLFTTDDVWRRLGEHPNIEPRALGAIMRRACKDGIIHATPNYVPSARVACHRRPVRVWQSSLKGNGHER